ncbi:cysteine-rich receptor-like protein kinase 15 [Fagus crenata]
MDLMVKITKEAASIPSKRMFSTGEIKYSRNRTIYGLVQCTRDISERFCDNCLVSALGDLKACCKSREGGIVVSRNCNVRYQMYRFYSTYPTSKDEERSHHALLHELASPTAVALTREGELSSTTPSVNDLTVSGISPR